MPGRRSPRAGVRCRWPVRSRPASGPRSARAGEDVRVKSLHQPRIQRRHPPSPRLGPRPVRVVPTPNIHMRPRHAAAQDLRIGEQMRIRTAQPAQLAATKPSTRHQQHHQPVPSRPAGGHQGHDLLVAGPVHASVRLMEPMPGPHPPRLRRVLPNEPPLADPGHLPAQRSAAATAPAPCRWSPRAPRTRGPRSGPR